MRALLVLPFVLQGAAMAVDEGVCHRRRGLPRVERIGHPLDALSAAACYAWLVLRAPSRDDLAVYAAIAACSCLFVTKDETVHATRCTASEQQIHAWLFVLHPITLGVAGYLWWTSQLRVVVVAELVLVLLLGVYQLVYWNGPWRTPTST